MPHHTEHNAECHYEEGLHKCLFECTQCTPEEPDQDPTEPSENLAKLSDEPTEPSEEPTEPSEEPTKPSEEPTEPSEEPTKPSEEPTEPSEEPTKPSEEPTEPSEEPTEPDAVCSCGSDDADWHAPFCPLYAAPEKPECYCVEKCVDGAVNEWCDVCYFDAAACAASGEEEGVQLDGTPVYIQSIAVAKDGSSGQTGINDCKKALQNAGYTVLDVDLNDGAGGDYIYMGYKTTTDPAEAIRGIIIRNGEYAPDTITHGNNGTFHKLGTYSEPNATGHGVVDLNSGCGSRSDYLYFYVTRSESYGGPVTELAFRTGKGNTGLDGFSVVTDTVYEAADANEGASGSYIYLFEKRFSVDIVIQTYHFHTAYEGPSVTFYDDKYHFSDHTRTYNVYFNGLRQFNYNGVTWTIAGFRDDDTIAAPNIKHGFLLTYQSAPYMVLRHVYSTTSTLSFDANGGTGAPAALSGTRYLIARKGSEPGETTLSLTIPATVPVWADKCAFLGWAASADATTAAYQPGDTYTLTSGNPTLYAVWQEHTGDTVCGNCGKSFAAPDQSNGVYQISNKEELIWFMQYVNQGNMNASAVVTANIDMGGYVWTPIASTDSYHVSAVTDKGYTGTFDGAGHVISNFKINGGSDGIKSYGLFGTVSGTVKNLGIRNVTFTVGSADCRAGGIAGQLLTGGRIENCCVTNSSITTGTRIAGGIAGCNYGGTIDRCYAYNNTVTGHSRCAAVVGDTVTDSSAPAKLTGTVTNCYADKKPVGSQNGGSSYVRNCGQLTADQFASGEATWLLNGSSASGAWKQTCGTGLPAFSGKTVYQVKRCDGVTVYSNESKNPQDHRYVNNVCTICGDVSSDAVAKVSFIGNNGTYFATLEDALAAVEDLDASGEGVVQLLQDVSMGEENLHIWAGVFTLDLNGKTLSSTAEDIGAVNVSGSNTDVTICNGTISGVNSAINTYDSGKVILENVTLTAGIGIITSENSEVILRSSVVNGSTYGLMLHGGTVHVYDSTITGESTDIAVWGGSAVLHEGVSFPGGITVNTTTLNDVLAEGQAYWAGETMLYAAADATEITDKGDVTVKAACGHENGEKSYVNNGDNHIYTYSCCGLEVPEDHDYTATGICICGKIDPDAQATLSKDGKLVMAGTLDAVIIKAWECTAADKAVVQLLRDVPMGNDCLIIDSGVFTLDLNGKILSNVDYGLGAVYVSGSNTDVIIRNGTINGGNNAVNPYNGGKVTLENVTLTGAFGISSGENSEVILRSSVVNGSTYGLLLHSGTVHVYDSAITGESADISVQDGGAAFLHEGVSFPGGITVNTTTLNDVLAEDLAYWAGETMLYAAADATEITDKGDVTVKAACGHENGEKSYVNNGDNHIFTYSCCGLEVPENHDYTATGICICGKTDPNAEATLSKDGKLVMAGTLDAVIIKAWECTAADKAVVQLLRDVPMGNGCLSIDSGVFTLDLNGKDISSDTYALDIEDAELVITDSSDTPGTIRTGGTGFSIWLSSGKVTIEKGNFIGRIYVSGGILTMVDGYVEAALDEPLCNNGGDVRLQGGTLNADSNLGWIRSNAGKVTVSGSPVFAGTAEGETFRLLGGTMDLSGMADPSGLTLWNNSGKAVPVSDVLLPEGYFFWLDRTAAEDTLLDNQAYTISQTAPDGSDADQKQINLYLKPVDEAGNEIHGDLDVYLNNAVWIGTESMDYGYATVNIGENILSGWDYYPNGYFRPTADIIFTYDLENGITITSGNAAAEQVGDTWYVVVTLTAQTAYPQVPENGWPIWVAGTVVTEDNCEDILGDGTVSYDPETETLTFQDAFIEVTGFAVLKSELPLTVNILGENEFYSEDVGECDYGFWFAYEEGTTEITGTGSVEIWSDDECIQMDGEDVELILSGSVEIMADPAYSSAVAIDIESVVASMTIQDAVHLTIGSESGKHKEEGIYIGFEGTTYGSMTIQDDAVVTIYTSDEEGIYVGGYEEQMLTITGGTVYIDADEEALDANTITISGGNITAIGGVEYEGIYACDLTITGGAVLVGCGDNGHAIEAQNITITGGTVRALNGGMIAVTVGGETGGGIPGTITLGEGMIIAEPEGAEIGELAVENMDSITGEPVTEEVKTIVDADGKYADAFVITDGKEPEPVYSGWTEIDGVWYYYDPETHEKFLDIAELTKGEGEEAVTGYYAFDHDTGAWMEDHTGVYEAVNGDLYYIEGGIAVKNYGLHKEVDANGHIHYYIFGCGLDDCKEGSILPGEEGQPSCQGEYKAQKNNFHMVSKLNGYELPAGAYDAGDDGVLLHYEDTSLNGICAVEGGLRYLINGVPIHVGLFEENGSLYYARTRGWLVVGTRYWISENKLNGVERNGVPVEAGIYEFDAEGRMIIVEDKNGFYLDNGAWYYYVDNKPSYEGLKYFDGTDGENGTNGGQMGPTEGRPGWYYINTYGMVIAGRDYWVTKNNGLMNSKTYCFDEYGTMTNPMDMNKAGIFAEDGSLYYYVAGERNYAGLIQYTGDLHHADGSVTAGIYNDDYLYVNTYGEVKNGCDYWITKNNGLMIVMTYNFDEYGRMTNPTISEPDEKVKNGIVREDDKLYYYVDGIRTYAGVIEIDGKYYYVRTHGELAANCSYWPTKHNGLVKVKTYVFDADGVMQNPVILK